MNGISYLEDGWNFIDVLAVTASTLNLFMQLIMGHRHLSCKVIMIFIIYLVIMKTFYFIRIFPTITPIVVMLGKVTYELKEFMLFFLIKILILSQMFTVLQLGKSSAS